MQYQPMLLGGQPYRAALCAGCNYQIPHCHKELEIFYVLSGQLQLILENQSYTVTEKEVVLVQSMKQHTIVESKEDNLFLSLEIGPFFLGEAYEMASKLLFEPPLCARSARTEPLFSMLDEIAEELRVNAPESELIIRGDLYKITAQLQRLFPMAENLSPHKQAYLQITAAEELLRNCYYTNITVSDAAEKTGYSVSSFCRIFKKVYGKSFHALLNETRLEKARYLLQDTTLSVSEIAQKTGFPDTKSFCRLFKKQTGMTATAYRQGGQ